MHNADPFGILAAREALARQFQKQTSSPQNTQRMERSRLISSSFVYAHTTFEMDTKGVEIEIKRYTYRDPSRYKGPTLRMLRKLRGVGQVRRITAPTQTRSYR